MRKTMTITLTRKEAQQVLDALEKISMGGHPDWADDVIPLLRARLSAPDLEPVAWLHSFTGYGWQVVPEKLYPTDQPLYTAPPQREWQGLTNEEREEATGWSVEHIEAKLREKNSD